MHCKDVSMRDVDFDIDEDSIARLMDGWTAYVRTEFLVLHHGDQYSVLELHKEQGKDSNQCTLENVWSCAGCSHTSIS